MSPRQRAFVEVYNKECLGTEKEYRCSVPVDRDFVDIEIENCVRLQHLFQIQRMIYTKEMKESLSGQDNRNAFMNLILGKDHGLFYIKNLFIEELAWIDRLHKNAWIGFQSWRAITRKVQKGSRSMLRNCVLAKDCDQPDYVKLAKALCVKHNVSLLTVPCAKTLGEWAGSKVRVKKECFKEWSRCRNSETWDKYKITRNETKKAVSEVRAQAFDGLYQALGTRDGERSIYRLAKGRERKTRDLDQVKCVKDEEGKVLVHEKDIKERWKVYFHNLFNDGYGYDSSSLDTREEDRNYKYYRRIQKQEVKEALKRMSNGKAVGPDNIPIEVWKTLGDRGLEWLTKLFNEIMRSKRMPEEWRRSMLVPIYKNKGDIQNCANYRGIKLMSHTMKLWERVIERRLRKETQVTENQFGFMPGRSTMEAIYLLWRVMEQYRMDQQDLHLIFIDLEKAYDRVPREILWKALEKKGVRVAYIRAIQDMYDRVSTSVRTQGGESDDFPITIGLHQGSTLSPYLFTLILDVLTEQIQEIAPRCMLFADDIVLLGESREDLNERLETWRRALETHGFRLSRSKSEYMECKFNKRRRVSNSEVKIGDHIIPQVTRFKYLGSVIQDDGEIEGDVNHRIQAGWMKWRKASGVLCDAKVPIKLKGKFYWTAVRPAILYGTECWAVKSQHENKVGVAEMRMLRWMCGKTRQDKIRNEAIRERVGVAPIVEKMVENRLRWFGHVERRPVDSVVRRVDQMERRQTIRGRGRPKKTIREVIKKDLKLNDLDRSMLCKIDSEGKARKVTRCSCNCATMTTSLHQLRLMFFLLHETTIIVIKRKECALRCPYRTRAKARVMSEIEEVQEQMKADTEAMKEQMTTMMEGMMSMRRMMEVNMAIVVAATTTTDVDPTHPSSFNQVNHLALDMVGQGGEALGRAGGPHFVQIQNKHSFPPCGLPLNYTPPNVVHAADENVDNSAPIPIESQQPQSDHAHVSLPMGETHEVPRGYTLADFEPHLRYAIEGGGDIF
ncbi:LINE-1 retrotransposable element ORF2 protein [Glycine soja]|uniref:LINE-1 retrotransposable element ORF2 protein n=1 Tax=Glycine soja TaxID=3848 RepID=A0A445JKB6_GLYSO|nr:LINE-1 retrotransposable element ORF2 protein [Glycine soja]